MCYNVKALLRSQLKRARIKGLYQDVEAIQKELFDLGVNNLYQASGFSHPKLMIYPDLESAPIPVLWGLVPNWVKDKQQQLQIWNQTLNARAETIFEKPAFRDSARSKRCLIYIDGFYEHHHFAGKTYPFYIAPKDAEPFVLAGLWAEWKDPETKSKLITFSIVTTSGNSLLAKIHNNPKLDGPRMPVILPEELGDIWLNPDKSQKELAELLLPYPDELMQVHTVNKLSGKGVIANDPNATNEFLYPELKIEL